MSLYHENSNVAQFKFDIDSVNKYTNYTCCTPLTSPNPTDKNIIVYQLKPSEQYTHPRNEQLAGMNNINDNEKAFSITFRITKVIIKS